MDALIKKEMEGTKQVGDGRAEDEGFGCFVMCEMGANGGKAPLPPLGQTQICAASVWMSGRTEGTFQSCKREYFIFVLCVLA